MKIQAALLKLLAEMHGLFKLAHPVYPFQPSLGTPCLTMCLGSQTVFALNRTSIRPSVFAKRSRMTDKLTDAPLYGIIGRNRPHDARCALDVVWSRF